MIQVLKVKKVLTSTKIALCFVFQVVYNKPTASKFSFGIRHSDYMTVPLFARD